MDKNTCLYIVLGFLLICIFLSLNKKEGFVVIREDLFKTQCSEQQGHQSCNVFLSGQDGVECGDAIDINNYIIPQEGTSKFTGSGFNMNPSGCSDIAYPNQEQLQSHQCDIEGQPYTLTGCSPLCIPPVNQPGYNYSNLSRFPPGSVVDMGNSIVCDSGYTNSINTCFNKSNGLPIESDETSCRANENLEWFGDNDEIKIYCENPGDTYKIMGCEQSCFSRIRRTADYLITEPNLLYTDYDGNKERIEDMRDRRLNGSDVEGKTILPSFPYGESDDSDFSPDNNFNVSLVANEGWMFETDEPTETCNIMGSDDTKNKYYVNGLYPSCNPETEECLNFNIVYDQGVGTTVPLSLEELRDELPVENIFPEDQIPDQSTEEGRADLNKYKNSLYYFRRFKNKDGNDEIEAQIRCDIDQGSDFHCSFTRGPGIKYVMGDPGRDCNDVCNRTESLVSANGERATCIEYQADDVLFSDAPGSNGLTRGTNRLYELLGSPSQHIPAIPGCMTDQAAQQNNVLGWNIPNKTLSEKIELFCNDDWQEKPEFAGLYNKDADGNPAPLWSLSTSSPDYHPCTSTTEWPNDNGETVRTKLNEHRNAFCLPRIPHSPDTYMVWEDSLMTQFASNPGPIDWGGCKRIEYGNTRHGPGRSFGTSTLQRYGWGRGQSDQACYHGDPDRVPSCDDGGPANRTYQRLCQCQYQR